MSGSPGSESFAANDPWSYRGLLLKPANHVGRSKICDAKGCRKVKKHSRRSWGIPYYFCDLHQEEIDDTYNAENQNTQILNAEWFTWYSGQYVLVRNVYRIYNRSVGGEEIVLPEEYSLLDDAVEELVNLIEYDPSIFEMGVYKIQSGMDPKVTLEVKYKHQEFSGDNPEAVKLADEKSYDRWNKDYLIDEPDDFLIGATDIGDIVSEVFVSSSEDKKIECQNCDQDHDLYCPQCGQPTCNTHFRSQFNSCQDCFKYLSQFMSESVIGTNKRLHFMDPKRRLRKLIKDIDIDPETAAKRISFNSERWNE